MKFVDLKELNAGLWFGRSGSMTVIVLLTGTVPFLKVQSAVYANTLALVEPRMFGAIKYVEGITPPYFT